MERPPGIENIEDKPDFEDAVRQYACKRVTQVVPGVVARLALMPKDLSDLPDNDPTNLDTYLVPCIPEDSEEASENFKNRTINFDWCTRRLDDYCDQYRLGEYPSLVVTTAHKEMPDSTAISILLRGGKYGEIRDVEDTYLIISRMIAYINFINPVFRPELIRKMTKHQPVNALEKVVLPTGNAVQVFQTTKTTQELWDVFEEEMDRNNLRALLQMSRKIKERKKSHPNNQSLIIIPPTATRMKLVGTGRDRYYLLGDIADKTESMLEKQHENGLPILPIGLGYSVPSIYLPWLPKTRIKIDPRPPIMPEDKFNREILEKVTYESAVGISSGIPVYWEKDIEE